MISQVFRAMFEFALSLDIYSFAMITIAIFSCILYFYYFLYI